MHKRTCGNGKDCISFGQLGEPAKLSASNNGPLCFRCEERRVEAGLEAAQPAEKGLVGSTVTARVTPQTPRKSPPKARSPKKIRVPSGPRCIGRSGEDDPCTNRAVWRWVSLWLSDENIIYLCDECVAHSHVRRRLDDRLQRLTAAHPAPGWWYTLDEAAKLLRVRSNTIWAWLYAGKLKKVSDRSERVLIDGESVRQLESMRSGRRYGRQPVQ
jgi:hypothetical protein